MRITLGSLFDGAGGFPLAGQMAGITPIWASEIEPFPIRVTTRRFPEMKHLGNIAEINGAKIEPVDIITFGSPCQDLSVANGKRKGLEGARSGLFHEAIRTIKEMREETNGKYPEFVVWENVPGAFSSNGGEDFRQVLQEIASVKDPDASIPRPNGGKWRNAGEIMGNNYNIAWRVYDAQYWGVPQRRKRIYIVADFRGQRAGHIQFERDSLCRDTASGGEQGEETTEGTGDSPAATGGTSYGCQSHKSVTANIFGNAEHTSCLETKMLPNITPPPIAFDNYNQTISETAQTLRAKSDNDHVGVVFAPTQQHYQSKKEYASQTTGADYINGWEVQSKRVCSTNGTSVTLSSGGGGLGARTGLYLVAQKQDETVGQPMNELNIKLHEPLIKSSNSHIRREHSIATVYENHQQDGRIKELGDVAPTVAAKYGTGGNNTPLVAYAFDRAAYNQGQNAQFDISVQKDTAQTVVARGPGAVAQPYTMGNGQLDTPPALTKRRGHRTVCTTSK